jgi:excisionase family DNA binding protein
VELAIGCHWCRVVTQKGRPYRPRQRLEVSQSLLSFDQVADRWGVTRRFIEQEVERGRLGKILLSRRTVRIALSEIERYETANTVGAK